MTAQTVSAFPHYPAAGYLPGMTLRDYFAAQAMGAIVSTYPWAVANSVCFHAIAGDAYEIADAMLEARADYAD